MTGPSPNLRILIADDHPLVLRGLSDLIGTEPDMQVVFSCADGLAASDYVRSHSPDIAVLDHNMPGRTGLEILRWIKEGGLPTRVLLLTADLADADVAAALALGGEGILTKTTAPDMLVRCLRELAAGRRWIPDEMREAAEREAWRQHQAARILEPLTDREREIVTLASGELSNKEIARLLEVAEGTVKIHLNNIYTKLGVNNRASLLRIIGPYLDILRGDRR